ncbi:zinc finger, CCHC-type containing protein [Tanacetum coccineum]
MITTPEFYLYYTATIRYTTYGIVKHPVKSSQPSHQVYGAVVGEYHEGYKNTIELLIGKNVVPLRSDTIRLVQNGCLFHGLWSKDPNQHLKDFLKLVDLLDLNGENRERTHLRLFHFYLHDQARNWLECLPAGSITTWEDLTTRFLAQLFPPVRTAKLRNDILMFQQHHGESLSEAWTRFKDLLQKFLIMALIIGFKFKFFKIMSPFILSARLTAPLAANSAIRILTNLEKSLRTSPSTTMRAGMTQKNLSNRSRLSLHLKAPQKHLTKDFLSSKT